MEKDRLAHISVPLLWSRNGIETEQQYHGLVQWSQRFAQAVSDDPLTDAVYLDLQIRYLWLYGFVLAAIEEWETKTSE